MTGFGGVYIWCRVCRVWGHFPKVFTRAFLRETLGKNLKTLHTLHHCVLLGGLSRFIIVATTTTNRVTFVKNFHKLVGVD